ncbi:MAG: hypothetical protein WCV00_09755 [Verrucomicrobiia bacterium]|jgi:hypothetical protein
MGSGTRFFIGRTIACAVAGLLCAASIFLLIFAHNHRRDFYQWKQARPIDIPVDLSKPGQFTGGFAQTCHISHGEAICLAVPTDVVAKTTWTNLLSNLRFVSQIQDRNGKEELKEEFTGEPFGRDHLIDGDFVLLMFRPFADGTYQMALTVTQGAPALHGVPQRLVARYMLCGMELMPAIIAKMMGIGGLIIAAAIVVITVWRAKRKQKTGAQHIPAGHTPPSPYGYVPVWQSKPPAETPRQTGSENEKN